MPKHAEGNVVVSGSGTLNAEVIAVGAGAQARKDVREVAPSVDDQAMAELRSKLEALRRAVEEHGSLVADPPALKELTQRVATQIEGPKPDKLSLKSFLAAIADEAKSVGEIAGAAIALKDVVGALF